MWCKEIGQIGRLTVLNNCEGQTDNFETNTLITWKQMEHFTCGGNEMVTPNSRMDDKGQGILPFLKPVKIYRRTTIVQ